MLTSICDRSRVRTESLRQFQMVFLSLVYQKRRPMCRTRVSRDSCIDGSAGALFISKLARHSQLTNIGSCSISNNLFILLLPSIGIESWNRFIFRLILWMKIRKATITKLIAQNHSIECTSESEQIGSCFVLRFSKLKISSNYKPLVAAKPLRAVNRNVVCRAMLIEQLSLVFLWKEEKRKQWLHAIYRVLFDIANRNNERMMSKNFSRTHHIMHTPKS